MDDRNPLGFIPRLRVVSAMTVFLVGEVGGPLNGPHPVSGHRVPGVDT